MPAPFQIIKSKRNSLNVVGCNLQDTVIAAACRINADQRQRLFLPPLFFETSPVKNGNTAVKKMHPDPLDVTFCDDLHGIFPQISLIPQGCKDQSEITGEICMVRNDQHDASGKQGIMHTACRMNHSVAEFRFDIREIVQNTRNSRR